MASWSDLSPEQQRRDVAAFLSPEGFARALWPKVRFYDRQREIMRSVAENDETFVVAGNQLGKDYVAGYLCLWFFLTRHEVRVVTTSVKDDHLRVLWGEIGRFLETCRVDLRWKKGAGLVIPVPGTRESVRVSLVVNHRDVRKVVNGTPCTISYLKGMVSERGEGMAGHHAAHTLAVIDEATGVEDTVYTQMDTWARTKLVFGNPNNCPETHFFRKGCTEGDLLAAPGRVERDPTAA